MAKSKQVVKPLDLESINKTHKEAHLLFGKQNYIIVAIGIIFIAVGFTLMAGGGSSDPTVFDYDQVYHPRRITIAPILVILGFLIELYAIVKKP